MLAENEARATNERSRPDSSGRDLCFPPATPNSRRPSDGAWGRRQTATDRVPKDRDLVPSRPGHRATESCGKGRTLTRKGNHDRNSPLSTHRQPPRCRGLFLSEKTVRNLVSSILNKLRVGSRAEAVAKARDAGVGEADLTGQEQPGP